MNLDALCSRDPSTIRNNCISIKTLISTCEASGFDAQIPSLVTPPVEDVFGYGVDLSMLVHSRIPGKTWSSTRSLQLL